jgi:hypothetical protein
MSNAWARKISSQSLQTNGGIFIHFPIWISRGRQYDVNWDRIGYGWRLFEIAFAIESLYSGCLIRFMWGWTPWRVKYEETV